MTQRVIPIHSPHYIDPEVLEQELDLEAVFGNSNPLALEIGCGTGHFIMARAIQQPNVNFLAIDIYNKGCLKTCKKLDAGDVKNVRVMRIEARYLLFKGLAPESLSAVYINCPDPWPKKRHRQRRLVNSDFLTMIAHYLRPGGELYFITDVEDYARQVAAQLSELSGYTNRLDADFRHDLPEYPQSKYMQRFRELGQPLFFLHHLRDPELPRTALPCSDFARGFRTNWRKAENA